MSRSSSSSSRNRSRRMRTRRKGQAPKQIMTCHLQRLELLPDLHLQHGQLEQQVGPPVDVHPVSGRRQL